MLENIYPFTIPKNPSSPRENNLGRHLLNGLRRARAGDLVTEWSDVSGCHFIAGRILLERALRWGWAQLRISLLFWQIRKENGAKGDWKIDWLQFFFQFLNPQPYPSWENHKNWKITDLLSTYLLAKIRWKDGAAEKDDKMDDAVKTSEISCQVHNLAQRNALVPQRASTLGDSIYDVCDKRWEIRLSVGNG